MKSTWFGHPSRHEFAKCLASVSYSHQHWDLFHDFLEIASCSMMQAVHKLNHGVLCEELEERVLTIQRRHPNWRMFCKALQVLMDALEAHPHDFLGSTMTDLSLNDKSYRGQFFTPEAVSTCMAEMALNDCKPHEDGSTFWISEPACGGGSMLSAVTEVLKRSGWSPWQFCWHAVDIDQRCFQMCYIQATLLDIPAIVEWGNTFSRESWDRRPTLSVAMHPPRESSRNSSASSAPPEETEAQMTLF